MQTHSHMDEHMPTAFTEPWLSLLDYLYASWHITAIRNIGLCPVRLADHWDVCPAGPKSQSLAAAATDHSRPNSFPFLTPGSSQSVASLGHSTTSSCGGFQGRSSLNYHMAPLGYVVMKYKSNSKTTAPNVLRCVPSSTLLELWGHLCCKDFITQESFKNRRVPIVYLSPVSCFIILTCLHTDIKRCLTHTKQVLEKIGPWWKTMDHGYATSSERVWFFTAGGNKPHVTSRNEFSSFECV